MKSPPKHAITVLCVVSLLLNCFLILSSSRSTDPVDKDMSCISYVHSGLFEGTVIYEDGDHKKYNFDIDLDALIYFRKAGYTLKASDEDTFFFCKD